MKPARLHLSLLLAALAAGAPAVARADAGFDKGFVISGEAGDKSYALVIGGLFQARFGLTLTDPGDDSVAFDLARARLILKGHLATKSLTFRFMPDFGRGTAVLKDYYVNYAFSEGLQLRVGQWKRPFSRQFITSSSGLALPDPVITDKAFETAYDLGLALHNGYERSPAFEWVVGLFNGSSDKPKYSGTVAVDDGTGTITSLSATNVPKQFRPLVIARVGYNVGPMKGEGYDELDLHPDAGLRFGVGASGLYDLGVDDDAGAIAGELDFILKASGFALTGGFYLRTLTGEESGLDKTGFHAVASYVIDGSVAPTLAFARVMPDSDAVATTQELAVGVTVLFDGHAWQWVTDVSALGHELGGTSSTDWRVRSQLQASF